MSCFTHWPNLCARHHYVLFQEVGSFLNSVINKGKYFFEGESGSVTSSSSSSKTADVAESVSQPPTAVSGIVASSAVSTATETTGTTSTSSSSSSSTSGGSNSNSKEMMIIMKSEADPSVILLQSRIQPDTMYQKQQDTLIVWNSETEGDLALSFEEIKGNYHHLFINLSSCF